MLRDLFEILFGRVNWFVGYVSGNYAFPETLSAQEEEEYIKRATQGDAQAANALIEHNLRLVAHVAKKYTSSGKETEELISIGTIGLIKGIRSYDGTKKTRLATYVARCIENEILMVLRSEKKLSGEVSLYEPLGYDTDGNEVTFIDIVGSDPDDVIDKVEISTGIEKLRYALKDALSERERTVVVMRYGLDNTKPKNQYEVADKLGISRSYVSRIEKKAIGKLKKYFEKVTVQT